MQVSFYCLLPLVGRRNEFSSGGNDEYISLHKKQSFSNSVKDSYQ